MRLTPHVAAALMVGIVALPALAAPPIDPGIGTSGPFAGVIGQGQTQAHLYDNNPGDNPCIQLAVPYTVFLTYAPASDVLTLKVGSHVDRGTGGFASVTFVSGVCTSFTIEVAGTQVGQKAGYVVTVSKLVGGQPIVIDGWS